MDLLCDSGPRSSVRFQSRCWPGLQSSEGLTEAGGFDSKMAMHMAFGRRPQFLADGCWWEAIVPHPVELSVVLPKCLHDMAAAFS